MTLIKVHCPTCGEAELPETDVTLHTSNLGWAYYDFVCPTCKEKIEKDAPPAVIHLLTHHARVPIQHTHAPAEVLERRHMMSAPRLTPDEYLDFAIKLTDDVIPMPEIRDARRWQGPG